VDSFVSQNLLNDQNPEKILILAPCFEVVLAALIISGSFDHKKKDSKEGV
jgi:hypothetical protein